LVYVAAYTRIHVMQTAARIAPDRVVAGPLVSVSDDTSRAR
jgi:hypothetical protein